MDEKNLERYLREKMKQQSYSVTTNLLLPLQKKRRKFEFYIKTRHIAIKYHFIIETISDGEI